MLFGLRILFFVGPIGKLDEMWLIGFLVESGGSSVKCFERWSMKGLRVRTLGGGVIDSFW